MKFPKSLLTDRIFNQYKKDRYYPAVVNYS